MYLQNNNDVNLFVEIDSRTHFEYSKREIGSTNTGIIELKIDNWFYK